MPEPAPPVPPLDAPTLKAITADLLSLYATTRPGDWPATPVLLALPWDETGTGPSVPVRAKSLSGTGDPVETFCHFRADPGHTALGLIIEGWSRRGPDAVDWRTLARAGGRIRDDPDARRVTILQMVARSGATALGLLEDGLEEPDCWATDDGEAPDGPCGPVVESMRRVFALGTPPCPVTVAELWASVWLGEIVTRWRRGRRHLAQSWMEVARLHPAMRVLEDMAAPLREDWLVPAGRAYAAAHSWDDLQLACVTGELAFPGISSAVAAWCDAGMFARLVLRSRPTVWELMPRVRRRLALDHIARVEAALEAWEVGWDPPQAA